VVGILLTIIEMSWHNCPKNAQIRVGITLIKAKENIVRISRICLVATAGLGLSFSMFAQPATPAALPPASVKIESISLQSVQPDRIELLARLGLIPERSLKVQVLSFSAMRVNDMPVYVSPMDGEFAMKKGEYFRLPDVRITIYYRDIASVEPVRRVVEQHKVTISGEITAKMDANPLEEIAMHSLHPRIVLPFTKEIPVLVPGGEPAGRAAMAVLDLAAQAGPAAAKLLGTVYPGQDAAWRNDLANEQMKHLVLIRTNYMIVDDTASYPLHFEQLGFWIGPTTVIVPEEAIKPWEFDPDSQAQLSGNHAKIDKGSISITAEPLVAAERVGIDGGTSAGIVPWSLSQGDFHVEVEGKAEKEHVAYTAKITSLEVRQRSSVNNYALLRFRDGFTGSPLKLADSAGSTWDHLAVFRLVRHEAGSDPRTEVVLLPGTSDGKQIRLGQQIDDSAFGSPVFTEDGGVAMVQDENLAVFLSSIKQLEENQK
jgi:hypothetical protein